MNSGRAPGYLPILLITLAPAGCNRYPDSYPPPIQRASAPDRSFYKHFLAVNDPDASAFLIKDIGGLENGAWRWTGQRPELRFVLERVNNLKFTMDFTIAGATFEKTGPITVSILINGHPLDSVKYATPGEKHFSKEVDPAWLKVNEDTVVAAEIQPPWISKDGIRLGVILVQAGFVE